MDYSTKWIKVELFATIIAQKVEKFTWKNIICRYDLPQAIVIDNERQFIEKDYEEFLKPLGIRHLTSSVEHPQTNGQVEAANKVILSELRKRLSKVPKGLWVDEPPSILWGVPLYSPFYHAENSIQVNLWHQSYDTRGNK